MPNQEVLRYIKIIRKKLERIYKQRGVIKTEWISMKKSDGIYSPRVDLAIGPFAVDGIYSSQFDVLMNYSKELIDNLIIHHIENTKDKFNFEHEEINFDLLERHNYNPRCFMAIEIENNVTRKHLMGSAINAASLGRLGIIIPWTEEKLRALVRMRDYLKFIYDRKRKKFDITNLLIIAKEQFKNVLNQEIKRNSFKNHKIKRLLNENN